jgi:PAS domain S-box-containing protein
MSDIEWSTGDLPLDVVRVPAGLVPIVEALNDAVVVADLTGRIMFANRATRTLLEWDPKDLLGESLTVLVPERFRAAHSSGLARIAADGPPRILGQPTRLPALGSHGRELTIELLLSILPTTDGGRLVVGTMRDVRERLDLEMDLTLVHQVLDVVSSSPGTTSALDQLLSTMASAVGWNGASLWEPTSAGGRLRCTRFWSDRDHSRMAETSAVTTFAPDVGLAGRVWSSGAAEWIPDVGADDNFPRRDAAAADGLHCAAAFPLTDGTRVVGVVELYKSTPAEVEAAIIGALGQLGPALGAWLARSRLQEAYDAVIDREIATADVFRRSLLPPTLPAPEWMDLAAAFVPGGDRSVGGDFYDAVEASGAGAVIAIGDVCGSGPEAAATSGLVRHSFRALASVDVSPAEICRRLNSLMLASAVDDRFCTVVIGAVVPEPGGLVCRLASGGHLDPIVIRESGEVEVVEVRGTALGVLASGTWTDIEVRLRHGDTLVVYTDGVTEARPPGGDWFGDDRLLALCAGLVGRESDDVVTAIRDAAVAHAGRVADDIAVLALTSRSAMSSPPSG